MRCEDTSANFVDYLIGRLGEAERQEIKSHLDGCLACRAEFEDLSQAWARLGELPALVADSAGMRARFARLVNAGLSSTALPDTAGKVSPATVSQPAPPAMCSSRNRLTASLEGHAALRPMLQACAAFLLLFVGFQFGRQTVPVGVPELSREVHDLKQMVILSLMQQQSASERLKGVNWTNRIDRPGDEIVAALIDTLMHDPNVNVRMASIDALKRFAERETVRSAMLRALSHQGSPLVQMALIDFVVETRDRGAIDALRRLSRDNAVDSSVRARAAWGIDHLETA